MKKIMFNDKYGLCAVHGVNVRKTTANLVVVVS